MKFEEKIKKLESIIADLENDNSDLDESIKKYTEAMNLIKECDLELKNVEENINKMINDDNIKDLEITD